MDGLHKLLLSESYIEQELCSLAEDDIVRSLTSALRICKLSVPPDVFARVVHAWLESLRVEAWYCDKQLWWLSRPHSNMVRRPK